ncbi:Nuclear protein localization [Nesidiocoris tenuis]|uniref:Nuclear protein localization n=1 Tax=Nesidiocoris tenuis TaxID=355587 RepID=A0ABN7BGD2_9HEMI|nr:Nuclear protein localization [Nesidiocoris tenuis]
METLGKSRYGRGMCMVMLWHLGMTGWEACVYGAAETLKSRYGRRVSIQTCCRTDPAPVSLGISYPCFPFQEHMGPLLQAVKEQDVIAATVWSRSEQWATVEQLISAYTREGPGAAMDGVQSQWTCPYCTFLNPSHLNACEMCSLPR